MGRPESAIINLWCLEVALVRLLLVAAATKSRSLLGFPLRENKRVGRDRVTVAGLLLLGGLVDRTLLGGVISRPGSAGGVRWLPCG